MEEIKALLVAFEEWKLMIYQSNPMMLETDDDDVVMMFMSSDSFKSKFSHLLKVIRTLPVEIVDFINYFCDVVKNTDVCRDGEIQAEWIKYNKNKDGKVSV